MLVNGESGNLIGMRDRGLLYGDGVFRTLCVRGGQPQHWLLHYQKLQQDCVALGIACPDFDLLSEELASLLPQHSDAVYKLIVTRGQAARGYAPAPDAIPTRLWDVSPLPAYPASWAEQGVPLYLCALRLGEQPRLAGIKHLNRLENVLAAAEFSGNGAAEGLMLDAQGRVIEGTRSNVFLASAGRLLTPDLSRCGVAGVQRERVLAAAAELGLPCEVRDIALDELLAADEVFLCNSVFGLWPVARLGGCSWSEFTLTHKLRDLLENAA
ncbi:MAG: aminodeoxychorismate lyase [Gallionella sp.]|nr:aminodeoxychorismate lyase [Gallionella sp.]